MAKIKTVVKAAKKNIEEEKKIREKAQKAVDASKKKKRGRPLLYSEAVAKERQKASKRKYNARQKAKKKVAEKQKTYEDAKQKYLEATSYTLRDAYNTNPQEWDEIGSPIAELLDEYDYDSKPLREIYNEKKKNNEDTSTIEQVMALVHMSKYQLEYEKAEEDYNEALKNQAITFLKTLESFL